MRFINMIKNVRNWHEYLFFKYSGRKNQPFVFKTGKSAIEVPPRLMHTFKECFFDSLYLQKFPSHLFKGSGINVVDVGANVGYFSLFILNTLPSAKVFSYEPMPVNYKKLNEYAGREKNKNWLAENKAIAGTRGTLRLFYNANDSFTTSASIHENSDEKDKAEVACITLKDVIEEYSLSEITLLKLDCEGSEYDILYNCEDEVLGKIKAITMETHAGKDKNGNKEALAAYLKTKGFHVVSDNTDLLWAWREG